MSSIKVIQQKHYLLLEYIIEYCSDMKRMSAKRNLAAHLPVPENSSGQRPPMRLKDLRPARIRWSTNQSGLMPQDMALLPVDIV